MNGNMPIPRDIYKHPAVHTDAGVTCVDCGGRVLDTPTYCRGVEWRCAACRQARQPMMPVMIPLGAQYDTNKVSPITTRVREYLRENGAATMADLLALFGGEYDKKAIAQSLGASRWIERAWDGTKDYWRLKEVKT